MVAFGLSPDPPRQDEAPTRPCRHVTRKRLRRPKRRYAPPTPESKARPGMNRTGPCGSYRTGLEFQKRLLVS